MSALTNQLQMLPMHMTEVVRQDRYRPLRSLSRMFICSKYDVEIHVWCFESMLPTNPRSSIFVSYGLRPRFEAAILVYGADRTREALDYVLAKTGDKVKVRQDAQFTENTVGCIAWEEFLPQTLGMFHALEYHEFLHIPDEPRSIDTMLECIRKVGVLFNDTAAHGISLLSRKDLIVDGMDVAPMLCSIVGRICRSGEMEGIFWSKELFVEAMKDHDIFADTNTPEHYVPDSPQLWYFDEPVALSLNPDDLAMAWWSPRWKLSAVAVVPSEYAGRKGCMALNIFEQSGADAADAYEQLPRVIMSNTAVAGEPCHSTCTMMLAGLEYMQEVLVRIPAAYSPGAKKDAARQGKTLTPYSTLVVRRFQEPEEQETNSISEETGRKYHFSFFQRRHRRRLKEPRKSDGVQVIRVAACQKCKHLPMKPGAAVKVTKVTR